METTIKTVTIPKRGVIYANDTDTYFINKLPSVKFESELVSMNAKLFNSKYIDEDTIAFANGELKPFKASLQNQPTAYTIDAALLWGYGDYKIKSGCYDGTGYVSSYTITIVDSKGYDKDVTLIKKWSRDINEVHIYLEEVESLVKKCEPLEIRIKRDESEFRSIVKEILRIRGCYNRQVLDKYVKKSNDAIYPNENNHKAQKIKDFQLYKACLNHMDSLDVDLRMRILTKFVPRIEDDIKLYSNYKENFQDTEGKEGYFENRLKTFKNKLVLLLEMIEDLKK